MAKIISVLSGKGGVGKTFFAANVAAALSEAGKSVLALDFDIGLKNLDLALGMQDASPFDFTDMLNEGVLTEQVVSTHPKHPELCYAGCPQFNDFSELPENALKNVTDSVKEKFDFIIIDCAAGIGDSVKNALSVSDFAIIIATPENTSVRDAEKTAAVIKESNVKKSFLVVNRVRPKDIKKGYLNNIDEIIDIVNIRLLGLIPEDEDTPIRANKGLLAIDSKRAKHQKIALRNIAKRINGIETPLYRFWK